MRVQVRASKGDRLTKNAQPGSSFKNCTPGHTLSFGAGRFRRLSGLAKKLLAEGVRGLVACFTTNEGSAISMGEQFEVLNAVLQIVLPGQAVMGLSGNNLPEVLAFQQKI